MKFILFIYLLSLSTVTFSSSVNPDTAVNTHNHWRNLLNKGMLESQPIPNPFIPDMYWDESLAASAQAHSDQCVWQHSGTGGENLYAHTGSWGSMEEGINLWAEEYKNYNYDTNMSINGSVVGHYTQVVWESSLRVGCGKTQCDPIINSDGSTLWSGTMYTCQYRSSGNWVGQKPYRISSIPTDQVDYTATNESLDFQLVNINGIIFRAKLKIKTTEPLIFEVLTYDQVDNIDVNEYPDIAYSEGTSIIIPTLTIDGIDYYKAEIKHIGNLEYEVINVQ
jgi:peptidase inhibitor 16